MTVDRVLLAAPRGFCAGVEMAIKALAWMVRSFEPPVYCYHEIVHNRVVVEQFRRAGVVFVDAVEEVPPGAPLMLSAHGSAPEVVSRARSLSPFVVDAVCPLVKKVHHEVRQRADDGYRIVYAGHRRHDEAVGTAAVAPTALDLVEGPADVARLDDRDAPVAFLAQTTLGLDEWQDTLAAARERFGEVWVPTRSDLCYATTNRQAALKALVPRCDAVVVVGSATSSNTLALVRLARGMVTAGVQVVRVDGPDELPAGLRGTVGITAGASAAEEVVERVVHRLAPTEGVEVVTVAKEDEYFPPPRDLRDLLRSLGQEGLLDEDATVAAHDVLRQLAPADPPEPPRLEVQFYPPDQATARTAPESPAPTSAQIATRQLAVLTPRIDREMLDVVEREVADPWLRSAIGYHLGWLDERFVAAGSRPPGGRKLRATFAVLAYQAVADSETVDPVLPFAAAVELVHNWSLVHDDIEDGETTRRGRPALWTICGDAKAINVGDSIFALGFRCLGRLRDSQVSEAEVGRLMSEVARTAVHLTEGRMRDLTYDTTGEMDSHRYVEMIEGRTAALVRCAAFGGAFLATGAQDGRAAELAEFGRQVGLACQLRDDILGIWGTDAGTGGRAGGDIRRRRMTLPVVVGLERAGPSDRLRLRQLYEEEFPVSPADEDFVRRVLDECGAGRLTQEWADRHRAQAVAALARVTDLAGTDAVAALLALADFVTRRDD